MIYGWTLKATIIKDSPIFIIGHWRSGTTYLHNLLCQSKQLAYLSSLQVAAPEFYIIADKIFSEEFLNKIMAAFTPPTRPMDNIAIAIDSPQEEEFAIANMSSYSFYHQWQFPRNARHYFEKYVLLENISKDSLNRWKDIYLKLLYKVTQKSRGKRVVAKNPCNTARIQILLDMFPNAKFIHIYRNPYTVFLSTRHLYNRFLPELQLQSVSHAEIEANILFFYEKLMKKFLTKKSLIPPGNLVEVKFEDLEANPLSELRRIYTGLNLPGFEDVEPAFSSYISSQAEYVKNQYELSPEDIKAVQQHWQFVFELWDYEVPCCE